ncbi:hypothetical protein [Alteribacter natronophilus]|uniref:hypothetical protein n=1 Tax=Alteribacter natronophilus TaxID=2583810 RepID=UPI00110E6D6C|nr:hypothetical protein [Alteribacter natronophilus]TMW70971.1 hypothetical protein FGB90_13435 [Alteribacter natronophilus]
MVMPRFVVSVAAGMLLLLTGVLVYQFVLEGSTVFLVALTLATVYAANRIGKSVWSGLASFIAFYTAAILFTAITGGGDGVRTLVDVLIYQGLSIIAATVFIAFTTKDPDEV